MDKPVILLIEDNEELKETVRENLEVDGYAVLGAANAHESLERLKKVKVDAILLDLVLPDGNGLQLIEKIRHYTDAPVIVVSGKGGLIDKVVGLEMGADDYIGKPFEMPELAARIKANVRRYKKNGAPVAASPSREAAKIGFGSCLLDRTQFQVFDERGESGGLTVKEFRLLETLVLAPNRVLSREQIIERTRERDFDVFDRAIDVQITRIRKKMEAKGMPLPLKTVRGAGYMLAAETYAVE